MKRQLAAILYANVAGYSRLTELDEEETHRKLDAGLNLLTDLNAAHGGQKIHEAGDTILVGFQSATSAVNFAVEFQRKMSMPNAQLAGDSQNCLEAAPNGARRRGDSLIGLDSRLAASAMR